MLRLVPAALAALAFLMPAQAWTDWYSVGGKQIEGEPALVNAGTVGEKKYVLVVHADDGKMWSTTSKDGINWTIWKSQGGELASSPTCVTRVPNVVDCWIKGSNGALWQRSKVGSSWQEWSTLGGKIDGQPFAWATWEFELAVLARSGDSLWSRTWTGNWFNWENTGKPMRAFSGGTCDGLSYRGETMMNDTDFEQTTFCIIRDSNNAFRQFGYSVPLDKQIEEGLFGMEPTRVTPDVYLQKQKQGEVATITILAVDGNVKQGKYIVGQGWTKSFQQIGEGKFTSSPSCVPGLCAVRGPDGEVWVSRSN